MSWSALIDSSFPYIMQSVLLNEILVGVNERKEGAQGGSGTLPVGGPFDSIAENMKSPSAISTEGHWVDTTDNGGTWDAFAGNFTSTAPVYTEAEILIQIGDVAFIRHTGPSQRMFFDSPTLFVQQMKKIINLFLWWRDISQPTGNSDPRYSLAESRANGNGGFQATDQLAWTAAKTTVEAKPWVTTTSPRATSLYSYAFSGGLVLVSFGSDSRLKWKLTGRTTLFSKEAVLMTFLSKKAFANFWDIVKPVGELYYELETIAAGASGTVESSILGGTVIPATAPALPPSQPPQTHSAVEVDKATNKTQFFILKYDIPGGFTKVP